MEGGREGGREEGMEGGREREGCQLAVGKHEVPVKK